MGSRDLKNKPLVEAIFEVHWNLQAKAPGVNIDPHYKLLLGRFYDRVRQLYPVHEALPQSGIPDELVGNLVQHRFRSAKDEWPLLQIGPGVVACNETAKYTWPNFKKQAVACFGALREAYPAVEALKIESLLLRYIDAVEFDYNNEDVFAFLREKMKVNVALPGELFEPGKVTPGPSGFLWQCTFNCAAPKSVFMLRFATGTKGTSPALVWETMVQSQGEAVPAMPGGLESWLDAAHWITDDWFFKLIDGELERRFNGG
ncbi:MAG: TIGR04255 family protein [Planctomycetota bacterium]